MGWVGVIGGGGNQPELEVDNLRGFEAPAGACNRPSDPDLGEAGSQGVGQKLLIIAVAGSYMGLVLERHQVSEDVDSLEQDLKSFPSS